MTHTMDLSCFTVLTPWHILPLPYRYNLETGEFECFNNTESQDKGCVTIDNVPICSVSGKPNSAKHSASNAMSKRG